MYKQRREEGLVTRWALFKRMTYRGTCCCDCLILCASLWRAHKTRGDAERCGFDAETRDEMY